MLKYLRKNSGGLLIPLSVLLMISACATTPEPQKTGVVTTKSVEAPSGEETEVTLGAVKGKGLEAGKAGEEKPYVVQLRDEERTEAERRGTRENLFSLHFKEITLDAVISMLSDRGRNFRYVIHPDVGERRVLGLVLENVTYREALEIVAKLHNLVIIDERNLIVINTYDNYMASQKQDAERIKVSQDRAEMERLTLAASLKSKQLSEDDRRTFRSYRLKYAEPNEVKSYLEKIFGGASQQAEGPTAEGATATASPVSGSSISKITFSTFTKASILTAYGTPIELDDVSRRIGEIDVPQQQIFIESRIVEIARSYSRSLGVQWGGSMNTSTKMAFPSTIGVGGTSQSVAATTTGVAATTPMGANTPAVNFPAVDPTSGNAAPAAVSIALSDIAGTLALNMRLSALEVEGKSKTLSNPKLTTINGVKAKIESGREIPYQQSAGGGGGATTVSFKNAAISMEVTPFITPDNMISLKIAAKKDDADFSNQVLNVPSILTRSIETSVLVTDGGTAVLGGVFENLQANTDKGVPLLSKVPILGWFFKGSEKMDNEKELLIFITPRIVRGNFS